MPGTVNLGHAGAMWGHHDAIKGPKRFNCGGQLIKQVLKRVVRDDAAGRSFREYERSDFMARRVEHFEHSADLMKRCRILCADHIPEKQMSFPEVLQ